MRLITGDIWETQDKLDILVVPTNVITKYPDERLVMGAGFARQVKEKYPGIDYFLGKKIFRQRRLVYGIVSSDHFSPVRIWAFQTKIEYKDDARLDLIGYSTIELIRRLQKMNEVRRVDMAFPGIGRGNLDPEIVMHTIKNLPDVVNIWRLE